MQKIKFRGARFGTVVESRVGIAANWWSWDYPLNAIARVFVSPEQISGGSAIVNGSDHHYLARVLRAKPGDLVELLDDRGGALSGSIVSLERDQTQIQIRGSMDTLPEPATHITVAQALGKFDKFEQVVQHGTEVGASQFVPIQAERSVVRLNNSDIKLARWRQIARDAARQCGRSRVPIVTQPAESLDLFSHDCELVLRGNSLPNGQIRAFMHTDVESQSVRTLLSGLSERPSEIAIAIGPEGGWSINEVTAALSSGWIAISLGRYVLRTETAALVAISRILQCFED